MKDKSVTTTLFIDKWHPKADGKCAVSIRITFNRKSQYFKIINPETDLPLALSLMEFEEVISNKPRKAFKEIAEQLRDRESKAREVIREIPFFTFEQFEKRWYVNQGAMDSIRTAYDLKIADLKRADQIKTAITYECAITSIEKYRKGMKFSDITPRLLKDYEKRMLDQEKRKATISLYLRTLRAIFNEAMDTGIITKDLYPFGRRKYEIPTGRNIKKALSLVDIQKLVNFKAATNSPEDMARDYWYLLYLLNGMNPKDLALLKRKHLTGDTIHFERAKTKNTKLDAIPIKVIITDHARAIIDRRGSKSQDQEDFIFPILEPGLSAKQITDKVANWIKWVNKYMKIISTDIGLNYSVTTITARHSFSTVLLRGGAPVGFISEAMGHSSIKTTQNYLAGFEDDQKREMAKLLTAFTQ